MVSTPQQKMYQMYSENYVCRGPYEFYIGVWWGGFYVAGWW